MDFTLTKIEILRVIREAFDFESAVKEICDEFIHPVSGDFKINDESTNTLNALTGLINDSPDYEEEADIEDIFPLLKKLEKYFGLEINKASSFFLKEKCMETYEYLKDKLQKSMLR